MALWEDVLWDGDLQAVFMGLPSRGRGSRGPSMDGHQRFSGCGQSLAAQGSGRLRSSYVDLKGIQSGQLPVFLFAGTSLRSYPALGSKSELGKGLHHKKFEQPTDSGRREQWVDRVLLTGAYLNQNGNKRWTLLMVKLC